MTKREAAVISAYTGVLLCEFEVVHEYIEELFNKPVFVHEIPGLQEEIEERSREEFEEIIQSQTV